MKYKISDIAKLLGITTMTVRRYEEKGYISPARNESDYRKYESQDISRIAEIRLLRKCGFSHEEIGGLIDSPQEKISDSLKEHLAELDSQITRLGFLRHWLKDNLEMLERARQIGDSFIFFDNPPMYYVTYSIGDSLLKGRDRLSTINSFMYVAEEVQLIRIYRYSDYMEGRYIPHACWAIKESDVKRLHLEDIIYDNPCVEYYPGQHCVYGTVSVTGGREIKGSVSSSDSNGIGKLPPSSDDSEESSGSVASLGDDWDDREPEFSLMDGFRRRMGEFMEKERLSFSGDIAVFMTDILGAISTFLICVPVTDAKCREEDRS